MVDIILSIVRYYQNKFSHRVGIKSKQKGWKGIWGGGGSV